MNKIRTNINLEDEKARAVYFHNMSEDSRELELLLNICYNSGIIPIFANKGHGKDTLAYIIIKVEKKDLETIGALIDLVEEIPNSEFNVKSDDEGLYAKLSCDSKDGEQLFTRIKDLIEESPFENKHAYNYKIMSTVYNIAKIVKEVINADILFATNEKLYGQGKCGLSIYKEKQQSKISTKKADDILAVINMLKTKATLNLPTVFFSTFEELRNFYFELDETVYSKEIEGENYGQ